MAASRAAAASDTSARLRAHGQSRDADAAGSTAAVLQSRAEQAQRDAMVADADANLASDAAEAADAARRRACDEAELLRTAGEMLQVAFDAAQDFEAPDEVLMQREAAAATAQGEADSTAACFDGLEAAVKRCERALQAAECDRARRKDVPALEAELSAQRRKVRCFAQPCISTCLFFGLSAPKRISQGTCCTCRFPFALGQCCKLEVANLRPCGVREAGGGAARGARCVHCSPARSGSCQAVS